MRAEWEGRERAFDTPKHRVCRLAVSTTDFLAKRVTVCDRGWVDSDIVDIQRLNHSRRAGRKPGEEACSR